MTDDRYTLIRVDITVSRKQFVKRIPSP
jgi:hypothetical protein